MKTVKNNFKALLAMILLLIVGPTGLARPLDSWTWRIPLPTGNFLFGVAFGNGQFVAVGEAGTVGTSPDGVTWSQRQRVTSNDLIGVTYGNGQFVAVGGNTAVTSPDGADWVEHRLPADSL